ncbi:MAG: tetratricopeptide repeat protein [Pseudomonadota bacterium]
MTLRIMFLLTAFAILPTESWAITSPEGPDRADRFTCTGNSVGATSGVTNHDDPESLYNLAYNFLHGICREQNVPLGISMMKSAADRRHVEAAFELAEIFYLDDFETVNVLQAEKYFLIAAEGGHLVAQHRLGMMRLRSATTSEDRWIALFWLGMAANQGDGFSAFSIGMLHQNGMHGLPEDKCLALDWYESAKLLGFEDTTGISDALNKQIGKECH